MTGDGLFIGKVAAQAGANPKTIRYYETIGLLPLPARGANHYRLYSQEVVEVLRFIKKAQALGLTLSEIKEIVNFRRRGEAPCLHVRGLLERKIADLDQKLKDLLMLRQKLAHLLARSRREKKRERIKAIVCPHIEGVPHELKPGG